MHVMLFVGPFVGPAGWTAAMPAVDPHGLTLSSTNLQVLSGMSLLAKHHSEDIFLSITSTYGKPTCPLMTRPSGGTRSH
jgi:hypothetical protein